MNINQITETFLWIQYREVRKSISANLDGAVSWLSSAKSWEFVSTIPRCLEYLSGELAIGAFGGHRTIWFSEEDPLLGLPKPVTVTNIGLTDKGDYLLEVIGQQSKRIKSKWERKYSERMRGFVTIIWKGETT